ncbi:hypothetical protein B0H13DRAFT_1855499 [Mycena leptocephala]|nr:hypothetical protein B0H13DRAFT_1855499 [Mycena leptocephala]
MMQGPAKASNGSKGTNPTRSNPFTLVRRLKFAVSEFAVWGLRLSTGLWFSRADEPPCTWAEFKKQNNNIKKRYKYTQLGPQSTRFAEPTLSLEIDWTERETPPHAPKDVCVDFRILCATRHGTHLLWNQNGIRASTWGHSQLEVRDQDGGDLLMRGADLAEDLWRYCIRPIYAAHRREMQNMLGYLTTHHLYFPNARVYCLGDKDPTNAGRRHLGGTRMRLVDESTKIVKDMSKMSKLS